MVRIYDHSKHIVYTYTIIYYYSYYNIRWKHIVYTYTIIYYDSYYNILWKEYTIMVNILLLRILSFRYICRYIITLLVYMMYE